MKQLDRMEIAVAESTLEKLFEKTGLTRPDGNTDWRRLLEKTG